MRRLIPIVAIPAVIAGLALGGSATQRLGGVRAATLSPLSKRAPSATRGKVALLIHYRAGQSSRLLRARAAAARLRVLRVIAQIDFEEVAPVDAGATRLPLGGTSAQPEPVRRVAHGPCAADQSCLIPNDPGFDFEWPLQSDAGTVFPRGAKPRFGADIDAPRAWRQTLGSPNVVIAVIDTGIDAGHRDLAGKVVLRTTIEGSGPLDQAGHGTAVAGIAAAKPDNHVGITGAGWSSSLMDVKVTDDTNGSLEPVIGCAELAQGIVFAADHGAQVINVSADSSVPCSAEQAAVDYATGHGSLVVAAAGNEASSAPHYPAAYPNVVSVAATDDSDHIARFSNHGDWVKLAAPGVSVPATLPHYPNATGLENYGFVDGTSYAAAYVSGIAALIWPITADTNGDGHVNDEVAQRLFHFADPISGTGRLWNFGRLNACRAAAARAGACPTSSTNAIVLPALRPAGTRPARPVPGLKSRRVRLASAAQAAARADLVLRADYAPELTHTRGIHEDCLRQGLDGFVCQASWHAAGAKYTATVKLRYYLHRGLHWHNGVPSALVCRGASCRPLVRTRAPAPVRIG